MKQQTIVERMKPIFPRLTQPIVSAVVTKRAGVQYTNSFRRIAEEKGIVFTHDRDGRALGNKFGFRLSDDEAAEFRRFVESTGHTQQEVLRNLVLTMLGVE